jgi:cytochrome c-type biogenesis protein CcsB
MNQGCLPTDGRSRGVPPALCWAALAFFGLALIGVMECLEAKNLAAGVPLEQMFSYQLISYANLLLIGSTTVYIAHLWFTDNVVGRWATGLSAAGAFGLVLGLMARVTETYLVDRTGYIPLTSLYEVMSLFSAVTVLLYLMMERVYRTRSAGAFVLPIVAAAVLFEAWLVSDDQVTSADHFPILRSYWIHAHVLTNFIGYGAFAVAAAMGVMYLLRSEAERRRLKGGFAMRALPDLAMIDRLMNQAITLGFPLFSIATILGVMSANQAWGRYWAWDPKETWALIVWLTYGGYFYLHYAKKWHGVRMAWWTIIGFGLTVFCFLGVNLFFSVLHSYG